LLANEVGKEFFMQTKVFLLKAFMLKTFLFLAALFIAGSISAYAEGAQDVIDVIRDASQGAPAGNTNPTTWTAVSNSIFGTDDITAIVWGNNRFVAVGSGGKIAYADW
jgi:hypothetical protein